MTEMQCVLYKAAKASATLVSVFTGRKGEMSGIFKESLSTCAELESGKASIWRIILPLCVDMFSNVIVWSILNFVWDSQVHPLALGATENLGVKDVVGEGKTAVSTGG